jgi:hypothetical protein
LAVAITSGCSDGLANVSGQVTLDGHPAGGADQYGTVSFYRESGGGAPAIGIIDESGRYTLKTGSHDGVEPGTYVVGVSVQRVAPPASPGDLPKLTLISPKKYANVNESGFRHDVKPGSNTIDFALSSTFK